MNFKKWINESLKDKSQYDDAMQAILALGYAGIDAEAASSEEIKNALLQIGKEPPEGTDLHLFVARIKSIATGGTVDDDFDKNKFMMRRKWPI